MLAAIDPGMNSPGVAIFRGGLGYELIRADRVVVPAGLAGERAGHRWLEVAKHIVAFIAKYTGGPVALTVVFECPQWYQHGKSKGDPNQLVGIAGVAANVTGMLSCRYPLNVESPTPAEWIGQLSKECPVCKTTRASRKGTRVKTFAKDCANCHGSAWETPRGRYIRKRLAPAELALVPDQNDAIDAVGLGLYALGRLSPQSVFSNGRDGR